jgi:multidrug efflux pump subunit AcrA (membrane-fusion protein)
MRNILIFSFLLLIVFSCTSIKKDEQYTIRKGSFSASVVESGELQAVNNNVIVVPGINWRYANQMKLTSLVDHGTRVKKGDVIAEIDKSSLMKTLFDIQSRLEVEQTSLDKMLIQQSTQKEEIEADIAAQEATYSLAKLQLERSKFDTEKRQTIKKLEFERATITLNRVKERKKAHDITSSKSLYIQKIRIKQIKDNIKDIEQNLTYFVIKAPVDGMIEIRRNWDTDQLLKVGDRIWPGYPVASIPDLSKMKVLAKVNETDISKFKLALPVDVRLQAYPDSAFNGKITRIFPICYSPEEDAKVKVFDFEILLSKSGEMLKPGMSVSCEVFFAQLDKVFYIENECIIRSDSASYIVLEKNKEYCPVTLGPSNNKFTIVSGKISEGDKVIPVSAIQTTFNQ